MLQTERGLTNNLRFLVMEVTRQVQTTLHLLDHPHAELKDRVRRRDGYIDHLKKAIGNQAFRLMQELDDTDESALRRARSATIIASNLERIGDHSVSIVDQVDRFTDPAFISGFDYRPFFDEINAALRLVVDAYESRDVGKGIRICRSEHRLDELYRDRLGQILDEMDRTSHARSLVPCLFIFHYLERMGDSLLNVGEAVLLSRVGENLKYREFSTLSDIAGDETENGSIEVQEVWNTKSGADVAKVERRHAGGDEVIYKHGDPKKLRLEAQNLERWGQIVPRLAPRVVQYQEDDLEASMLVEFIDGRTLQEILLSANRKLLSDAIEALLRTLREIWVETEVEEEIRPGFVAQISSRLRDVYEIHPYFEQKSSANIGTLTIPGLEQLLDEIAHLDDALAAPFSIFGHGDFNVDNIIYSAKHDRVHFVDVHRSNRMDYVQDLSVFLVSNFRLPVFGNEVRICLNQVETTVFRFARSFAREQGDLQFEARMALGLARSFLTSTRFEFDREFAENMLRRAVFLLQGLHRHVGRPWELYRLPEDVLLY
jgi:phosphate uptake regulator